MANNKMKNKRCRGCRHLGFYDVVRNAHKVPYCNKYLTILNRDKILRIHVERCEKCIEDYFIKCDDCKYRSVYHNFYLGDNNECNNKDSRYFGVDWDNTVKGCVNGVKQYKLE